MNIQGLYAAVCVKDLAAASTFYSTLLGRDPDDKPMDNLVQWRGFGNAGIQLFQDAAKAGQGTMTIVIADLDGTKSQLDSRDIQVGDVQQGDFGKVAQVIDPDGNVITLAEPPGNA